MAKKRDRKAYMQKWRADKKEHCRQWRVKRYQKHKDDEIKKNLQYRRAHADRVNENQAKRYARDPEKFKRIVREWQRANPVKFKVMIQNRRAREEGARGRCSAQQLEARLEFYGYRCAYCAREFEQVDHVIALASGGTAWPANLRPACQKCNAKKRDKPWRKWLNVVRARMAA